jgi:hypothetical protein
MTILRNAICGAGLSLLLCASASAAVVTRAAPAAPSVNPFAFIGLYGSQASAQALCGNSATIAVAGAAASAQTPGTGCVLPVVDTPPVAAQPGVPSTPGPLPLPGPSFSLTPLLLGLLGIGTLIALIASQNGEDDSPPVSPA